MAPEWARERPPALRQRRPGRLPRPRRRSRSVERFDRWLFVWARGNTAERAGIASARDAAHGAGARAAGSARHDEREAAGELRWVGAAYPTALGAQTARMGTAAWERFVYSALLLDEPDPVAAWRALGERHARLIERLAGAQRAAHHGRGHRPARERRGARLGILRRRGEPARRRGLLLPADGRRRGRDHVRRALAATTAGRAATCACASTRASSWRRRPRSARTCCSRGSTPTRARAASASSRSGRTR